MFTDEFYKMTAADQNNFAEVCNKLLLKGFIVRDIFDNKEKMMRVNPDYRFLERFFEVFESYLKFSGWRIEKDNILGVIALSNDYNDNRVKVDRETSLVLFITVYTLSTYPSTSLVSGLIFSCCKWILTE